MQTIDLGAIARCACGHLHPSDSLALVAGSLVCRDPACYASVVLLHREGTTLPVFRRRIDPGQKAERPAMKTVQPEDSHGPAPVVLSAT